MRCELELEGFCTFEGTCPSGTKIKDFPHPRCDVTEDELIEIFEECFDCLGANDLNCGCPISFPDLDCIRINDKTVIKEDK